MPRDTRFGGEYDYPLEIETFYRKMKRPPKVAHPFIIRLNRHPHNFLICVDHPVTDGDDGLQGQFGGGDRFDHVG